MGILLKTSGCYDEGVRNRNIQAGSALRQERESSLCKYTGVYITSIPAVSASFSLAGSPTVAKALLNDTLNYSTL